MTDAVILMMILSGVVALIAWKAQSRAIMILAAFGWIITGLQLITTEPEIPPFIFLFFMGVSAAEFMLVGDNRWLYRSRLPT